MSFDDPHVRLAQAQRLFNSRQAGAAQLICEELVARHPAYTGALDLLGVIHLAKSEYPRALSYLVRSTMLNPFDINSLKRLGTTYVRLEAWEMAARTFGFLRIGSVLFMSM